MTFRFARLTASPPIALRRPGATTVARWLASMLVAGGAACVAAQEAPRNFIALGAISTPEFEGSSDNATVPLVVGRIGLGGYGSLRLAGTGVQYNVLGDGSAWAFGPVLSFRPARDADVEDVVVQRLREIDSVAEFGLFLEYSVRNTLANGDRIGLGIDVKGGKGNQVAFSVAYLAPKQSAFQFGADARVVVANDKYMDTYFSVDADNSARSGLPTYSASGGAKNFALGLTATYDLNRNWLLLGRVGVSRLLGDAKDSPIVQLRGDANATTFGVAVGYRF